MEKPKDQSLLERFQSDPESAFPELFERYYSLVCDQIYKIIGSTRDVEDIAQDIFYELYQKRNQLKIKTSIASYLRVMARTRTLNFIRDRKIKWQTDDSELQFEADNEMTPEERLHHEELDAFITRTIDALPERCRLVFALSRYEGMSRAEIADKLDI